MVDFLIRCKGHKSYYEIYELVKVFLQNVNIKETDECALTYGQSFFLDTSIGEDIIVTFYTPDGKKYFKSNMAFMDSKENRIMVKVLVFQILAEYTQFYPQWGILTGIRPAKIPQKLLDQGKSIKEILNELTNKYQISKNKAKLLTDIALRGRKILQDTPKNSISLYISIPFCPSRCHYCTFLSKVYKNPGEVSVYLTALKEEIIENAAILREYDIKIDTLYIGGGTPTILSEEQMESTFRLIEQNFEISSLREFTVEAGRPDTMTDKKLKSLKALGVSRLSINPQTMNEKTLIRIGRNHTTDEIIDVFNIARNIGFNNINADIIIGLPKEGIDDVKVTLNNIKTLKPESITVHTLAVKRASLLRMNLCEYDLPTPKTVEESLNLVTSLMESMSLAPYYLYRQKYMVGNFENIGYALSGKEGIYNIQIMEERQTILALGAGGISKIILPDNDEILRVPNVKNLPDYINRIKEMIISKKESIVKAQELVKAKN